MDESFLLESNSSESRSVAVPGEAHTEIARLWTLRVLADGRYLRRLAWMAGDRPFGEDLLEQLELLPDQTEPLTNKEIGQIVREEKQAMEAQHPTLEPVLSTNLDRLCHQFRFGEVERDILAFAVLFDRDELLRGLSHHIGQCFNLHQVAWTLGAGLRRNATEVYRCLSSDGSLRRTGITTYNEADMLVMETVLELLPGLANALLEEDFDPIKSLENYFSRSEPARLARKDFLHLDELYTITETLLVDAAQQKRKGVNVLFHGKPGVGKTELARTVAQSCGLDLFEISALDSGKQEIEDTKRLQAFRFAESALAEFENAAILIDEADALLELENPWAMLFRGNRSSMKHTLNRALERNRVPVIWIVNEIRHADDAFMRRFDFVGKLPGCPKSVRERLLRETSLPQIVSNRWLSGAARIDELTPALINKIGSLADRLDRLSKKPVEQHLEKSLEAFVPRSVIRRKISKNGNCTLPYKLEYVNPDADLEKVIGSVQSNPDLNMLLSGPPGTGKSAFAAHLAEQLDVSLLKYRASDLLSCYVGQTERKIGEMFESGEQDDCILLLDEADSFLFDRSGATTSWERTEVNEFLTQLETFQGTFIAATNFSKVLDSAFFRRFELKISLRPLTPRQRLKLYRECLVAVGREASVSEDLEARLAKLDGLTVGDYITALRKVDRQLREAECETALVDALEGEFSSHPDRNVGGIGFNAQI